MNFPAAAWRGVFDDYRKAVGPSTEAPESFHFGNFLAVSGHSFGRKTWVECPLPVYFNFATLQVGETGRERKTTAQGLSLDVRPHPSSPLKLLLRGVPGSGEGLLEALGDDANGTEHVGIMVLDEFSGALRKGSQKGNTLVENMIQLLDGATPLQLKTRTNPVTCTNALLTVTANATLGSIEDRLTDELVLSGLLNRFMVFRGKANAVVPNPARPSKAAIDQIRHHLENAILAAPGPIRLSPAAEARWASFYQDRMQEACKVEIERAVTARIDLHIRRVSGLYAALEGTPEVTQDQLEAAIEVGLFCEQSAIQLVREAGASRDAKVEKRVIEILKARGCACKRRALHQTLGGKVSGDKLARLLKGLEDMGMITRSASIITLVPDEDQGR
mgnify:CR=1 FL=1